jgi:formylglycine-generating enzyme required for sulfatase activity
MKQRFEFLLGMALFCMAAFSCRNAQGNHPAAAETLRCVNPASRAGLLTGAAVTTDSTGLHNGSGVQVQSLLDTAHWPPKPWPPNMVWVPAGAFSMGGEGREAREDEFPVHRVKLDGFWMDATEVTIASFKQFVKATGYITTAEQKPDWNQLKQGLPPGTPKPPEEALVAGALVFHTTAGPVPLNDYAQWWSYVPGASWKHPQGDKTDVAATSRFDRHPVTQVSWFDAQAYCQWAHKQLPTEAQWEYAARGGLQDKVYSWGDEAPSVTHRHANLWQGRFPYAPEAKDGFLLTAPVQSFAPNGYGLFDMTGNVWEWCADWYRPDTYATEAKQGEVINPRGPGNSYDPDEPYAAKRVIRGGSFLCNEEYCASYRPAARMKTDPYTGQNHTGFRCVMTQAQWLALQGGGR